MREQELRANQREIHRMHVVRLTIEGRESVGRGAKLLGISVRQMKRLRRKMKERGDEGLLHVSFTRFSQRVSPIYLFKFTMQCFYS